MAALRGAYGRYGVGECLGVRAALRGAYGRYGVGECLGVRASPRGAEGEGQRAWASSDP